MTFSMGDIRSSKVAVAVWLFAACSSEPGSEGAFSAGPTAGSTQDGTGSAESSSSDTTDATDDTVDTDDDGPKLDIGGDFGGGADDRGEVEDNPIFPPTG